MKKRVFICPVNDGESVEIRKLLTKAGELVVVTRQPWGASWSNLEPEVEAEVEKLLADNPGAEVIGIELAGPARWGGQNIDHHFYPGDDRRNELSSLEQTARLLGVKLTTYQQLVAINDKGWIPALLVAGASPDEIALVRAQDRLAQGVTPDDEAQAVRDIETAEWRGRKVLIQCPHGATSALTDRLFGQYDEALTVDAVSEKWVYYGPRHLLFFALTEGRTRSRWAGGADSSGFSGAEPEESLQEELIQFFWEE